MTLQTAASGVQNTFRALADPTRREILLHLSGGEMTIGEIVDKFDMTRAAVKKHLDILHHGQLISVHPRGRERINRLEPGGLKPVTDWLTYFEQFWDQKLADLGATIEKEQSKRHD